LRKPSQRFGDLTTISIGDLRHDAHNETFVGFDHSDVCGHWLPRVDGAAELASAEVTLLA
jgi:hypothetical protein